MRAGQTEASVDLARMAGLVPAGVICEIMNEDGTMARVPDLVSFCATHGLKMVTVAELIRYRLQHERYIRAVAEGLLATAYGNFRMIAYESDVDAGESHVALIYGDVAGDEVATVRVQTHNLAEDVFGEGRRVIDESLRMIAKAGRGAFVYLHNGTAGFGIDRVGPPVGGRNGLQRITFERNARAGGGSEQRTLRQVGLGGQILSDLGIHKIRLLTNTPTHVPALQGFGIEIVEQVPLVRVGAAPIPK